MATLKAKTLEDFMKENDRDTMVRSKIQLALRQMLNSGKEQHETETDLARLAGLQLAELTRLRAEFHKHVAFVPKLMGRKARFVWFADPKVVPAKFRWTPEKDSE
jgi:hypothetical protein